jgi:RHS repeat-associated protein
LGSTVALTDGTGNVVESYRYDVYGAVSAFDANGLPVTTPPITRFLFTGREYLAELGLYDYRNRMYSQTLGRFLQPDPIGFDAKDVNLYRYVANNPFGLSDPFGLAPIDDLIRRYLLGQVRIGIGVGIAEVAAQLATCALLKPGEVATIRSPVSQVLNIVLIPITQGRYIIMLEVTKNKCGATECDYRYIGVTIGSYQPPIA